MLIWAKATPVREASRKPCGLEAATRDVQRLPVEACRSGYPAFSLRRPVMYLCRTLEMRV